MMESTPPTPTGSHRHEEGWLPKGMQLRGKRQLIEALHDWLGRPGADTIGDTRTFHGRFWIRADVGAYRVRLAADTTRKAAQAVVDYARANPEQPWHVVANQNGRINKVVVTNRVDPGWYAYLATPLDTETAI